MACIAPPPAEVAAIIQVGPAAAGYPLTYRAADPTSANYLVNDKGDWDFSCFRRPIRVRLSIGTPGFVFFHGGDKDGILFAEDPTGTKQAVKPGHHQFPGGLQHVTAQSLWFKYHNDWDCGAGDGQKRCAASAYGVSIGDGAGGFVHDSDPIIQNGGN
jgi:hypothetical protein